MDSDIKSLYACIRECVAVTSPSVAKLNQLVFGHYINEL